MSSSEPQDTIDHAPASPSSKPKEWVKFEEEEAAEKTQELRNGAQEAESRTAAPARINAESVTVNVNKIAKAAESRTEGHDEYTGAVIATKSVQINLDRSGMNRSISSDSPEANVPSKVPNWEAKSASLKTIDLRDTASNGRNVISTPIGNIRQGFANGDTIVTLLPVNTRWPWVTPARFRPELVPEELMAQGLTLTVEDYVHVMELLVNDVRFNMYNICYKRILVLWIFTAFVVLLGLLFSGVTGLTLFGLGIMWLILNAAAIFLCMFIKIKLNHNLERCLAQVNKHLLRHKILLGLDDRGKISCHKVNLCFIYFDTAECIKKLQDVIEREERDGRVIGGNEENARSRRRQELAQRMDIDDSDIVIQGSTTTRLSRKQERAELLLLRYASRWARNFFCGRLNLAVDAQDRNSLGLSVTPRHCISARCPCQFIEDHLKYKPKGYPPGFTWCAYFSDPAVRMPLDGPPYIPSTQTFFGFIMYTKMEVDENEEIDRMEEPDITPLMPVVIEELDHTGDRSLEMEEFVEAEPIHVEQLNNFETGNENMTYVSPYDVTEYETADVLSQEIDEDQLTKQFISGKITFMEYSSTLDHDGDFESSDIDLARNEGGIKLRNTEARMRAQSRKRKTLPLALQGLMGEANVRFAKGQTELAAQMCLEIIRQVPSAPEPFQTLAMIYENDQPEKSLQFALIAAHLSPKDADQWVRLANLSLEADNLKQAVACYSKAIIASPKDSRLYDARAQLQERLGDKKGALRGYVKLLHILGPEDAGLIMTYAKMLAKQFMQENNYEQAFHAMDNLFNKCPEMVTLGEVNIMVELLIVLKKFHRCLELLQKYTSIWVSYGMIQGEETMVISATELKKETSVAVRYIEACGIPDDVPVDLKAKCLIALIELNELQIAEALLPNLYENENPEISGDLFLDIAEALMSKKQFVRALSLLEPLVHSSNYSLAAVWLRYAECWMGCGDVQKAISSYEVVCNLSPRHIEAKLELARLYEERNLLNEAIAVLDQDPEDDVFDPDVLYKRTKLLFRTQRFDEYFKSAVCLFSRHCVVLRSKSELTALTKSAGLRQRLECLHLHRLSRGENLEDDNAPSFIRADVPSFDEEFALFLEVCDMAYKMKRYGLLQKVCFSALTSKKFDCKYAHIMFLCLISCIHTNDTYHGFNVVRELIRTDPKTNYWNLLNVIIQRAEDSRHNRFMMRLLTREEVFSHLHILHANNCLVSGTYKYALNDYISLFKAEPTALLALLIAVTQLQMACQKFAARKNQIVVQALAFMQKYAQARGKGGEQETSYNLGRAFHQLGLIPAAVHYYKQVLTSSPPKLVQENSELLDLKREAAFNLHLIYLQSDNRHLANMYIQNFITI